MRNENDYSIEKEILESRGQSNVEDEDIKMINARNTKKKKSYVEKVDKINTKNFRKRRLLITFICVLVLSFAFIIGGSFALSDDESKTDGTSTLEAGTMKLSFREEDSAINMNNALPQTKKDALLNNKTYEFSITNTGEIASNYFLSLDNSCTTSQSYKINGNLIRPDICIPDKYIRVALSTNGSDYKILQREDKSETFLLETGVLDSNKTNKYKLKIWLAVETPNNYNSKGTNNVVYSGILNLVYKQITNNELDN